MKVELKAGMTADITYHLKAEAFGLYDEAGRFELKAGEYKVSFGFCQPEERSESLTGSKVWTKILRV